MTALEIAQMVALGLSVIERLLPLIEKGRAILAVGEGVDEATLADIDAGIEAAAARCKAIIAANTP
jgi:hypothetical protein